MSGLVFACAVLLCPAQSGSEYFGDADDARSPAVVIAAEAFKVIDEYKEIRSRGLGDKDAEYWALLSKANRKFYAALRKVAEKHGFDAVVEKGSAPFDPDPPDITAKVISSLTGEAVEEKPKHPFWLPDFSHAGYHAGKVKMSVRKPTVVLKREGEDHTELLRAAVKKGGVIRIPEGRWTLTDILSLDGNNVVLQGAGSEKTVLVCPKSLADILGANKNWSWSGGLIRITPKGGAQQTVGTVIKSARSGGKWLTLELKKGVPPPKKGEWLQMLWHNDRGKDTLLNHLYAGLVDSDDMGKQLKEDTGPRVRRWVQLASVKGNKVKLALPLPIEVRPEWNPTLIRRPAVREVGIEGLTIEFPQTKYPGHLKERGYNAIHVSSAINCWIRDVRIRHADSGIFVSNSKHVTVTDILIEGREMHHGLEVSWSSECLFTKWRIEAAARHGTTVTWSAHRNVFSNGYGKNLHMDAHRAVNFQNLHTDIVIDHGKLAPRPFYSGGNPMTMIGPHSAKQNVYWNIENRFNEDVEDEPVCITGHEEWPMGIFVGWHGNRKLVFGPTEGMKQQVLQLGDRPEIRNLHRHQADMR